MITIDSIRLVDYKNKKAKKVEFKDGINLISSEKNSVGKSVIMKSIYHALGAQAVFDSNFKTDDIIFEECFRFNEKKYRIIRKNDDYAIFENDELKVFVKAGNIIKLAEFYKNSLNMSVFLRNRDNQTELVPPAYLFIPYYLDQDRSWKEDQEPFTKQTMSQYYAFNKNDLYLYHLGLYDDTYGELKSQIDSLKVEIVNAKSEQKKMDESLNEIKILFDNQGSFCVNEELESMMRTNSQIMSNLFNKQNTLKSELYSQDVLKNKCINKLREMDDVLQKITNGIKIDEREVVCPNCESTFTIDLHDEMVSIYNKLFIENEKTTINQEINAINEKIIHLKAQIDDVTNAIENENEKIAKINNDYENYVTRKSLSSVYEKLLTKMGELSSGILSKESDLREKEKIKNDIKQSTSEAKNDFINYYAEYLLDLGVTNFNMQEIRAFKKLSLSGSQYVRSTLALYFAFLKTKNTYNKEGYLWPLLIDSPREGEQDKFNSEKILKFILNNVFKNYQTIVATVNANDFLTSDDLSDINLIQLPNNVDSVMTEIEFEQEKEENLSLVAFFERS